MNLSEVAKVENSCREPFKSGLGSDALGVGIRQSHPSISIMKAVAGYDLDATGIDRGRFEGQMIYYGI